jgi:hypothetical protein
MLEQRVPRLSTVGENISQPPIRHSGSTQNGLLNMCVEEIKHRSKTFSTISDNPLGPGFYSASKTMSTRRRKICFWAVKRRPMRKSDNFTTICEPSVQKMWSS